MTNSQDQSFATLQTFLTQLLQRLDNLTVSINNLVEADHRHDLASQSTQIQLQLLTTKLSEADAKMAKTDSRIDALLAEQAESNKKLIRWLGTAIGSATIAIVLNTTGWIK